MRSAMSSLIKLFILSIPVLFCQKPGYSAGTAEAVSAVAGMTDTGVKAAQKEINDTRLIVSGKNEAYTQLLGETIKTMEATIESEFKIVAKDYKVMRCFNAIRAYIAELEEDEIDKEIEIIVLSDFTDASFFDKQSACNNLSLRNA